MSSEVPEWMIESARVYELHAVAIDKWGGMPGVKRAGCVDSSVQSALTAAYYVNLDDEPDPLTVAVHVLVYLALNHCFHDGNKRIALMACVEVLNSIGLTIAGDQDEIAEMVESVAKRSRGTDDVRTWLEAPGRLVPWDPE